MRRWLACSILGMACLGLGLGLGLGAQAQSGGTPDYAERLAGVGAPAGQPSGLLLGLRRGDGYRALFVVQDAGSVKIGADLPFLAAPQADGFLLARPVTVTLAEACADCQESPESPAFITAIMRGRTVGEIVDSAARIAEPLREAYEFAADSPFPAGFAYESDEQVTFIADGAYCAAFDLYGYTGGAHPFHSDLTHCIDPDAVGRFAEAEPLRLAGLVEPDRLAALRRALRAEAEAGRFEELDEADPALLAETFGVDTGDPVFRLARRGGRTAMTALAYGDAPYYLTGTYRVTVSVPAGPAPDALAPYNPELPFYEALQASDPQVTDAFLSPGNGMAAILSAERLLVIRPQDGTVLHSMALPHEAVVAADWAVGDAVTRWQAALAALGRDYCDRLPDACAGRPAP